MYCIVVGGGRLGTALGSLLANDGNDVVVIERSPDVANSLRAETGFFVIAGDGTEVATLEAAGAGKADVLFAVTGDDNANLVAAQVGEYQFAIPNVIIGVNNPRNVKVFKELGVRKVVDRTSDAVQKVSDAMNDIRASAVVGDGAARVMEFEVERGSYADQTPIEKLYLPEEALVGAVIRGGRIVEPKMNVKLRAGDTVIVITSPEETDRVWKIFSKETE